MMQSQEWFDDRFDRIRDLVYGDPGQPIMPELVRTLTELQSAVENLAMRGSEDDSSQIILQALSSRADREAFYKQYKIRKRFHFSCLQL